MAIRTVTTSTTDPTQNNMAEFTAEFNARKAVIGKNDGAPNPNVTIGRRATAGDDSSAAEAAAAVKAAADKAAADAAAAAAGDKKGAKPGELDDLHDEADGDKKKKGLDARFSKLTGEREQAKRERDEATARADKLQAQIDAIDAAKQAVADAKPAPVPTDFKTPEEYAEALAEFKVEKKLAEKAKQDAKTALEAANLAVIADFNKRVAEARKELPDYDEVTSTSPVPVHDFVKNLLIESPVGPWVLHWLATHPDRVTNINAMAEKGNLRGASISFGRLEQQIEDDRDAARADADESTKKTAKEKADAKAAEEAAAAAAKAGKAVEIPGMVSTPKAKPPEPISRISGTGSSASVGAEGKFDKDGNFTGSPKEWRALRKAGKIN